MSISDNYAPNKSVGNGVTTVFTGNWKVLNASYFRLALENIATGVQTLQTQGLDYTLTFNDSGYVATMAVAPSSAFNVIRYRSIDLTQTDPYRTSKGFQGKVIEDSLDKLTGISQDQQDAIDRSLTFAIGSTSSTTLPEPQDGYVLGWNTLGKLVNYALGTLVGVLTVVLSGLAAGDALVYNGTVWVNRKILGLKGTAIPSATTTDIGAADSDFIDVTGTTTIASFGLSTTRNHLWINFTAALTITASANILTPDGNNLTTAANDTIEVIRVSGSIWKIVKVQKQGGLTYSQIAAVAIATAAEIRAGTASKLIDAATLKTVMAPWVYGTPVATTSGSTVPVASFPAGVTEFEVYWRDGSTTGTNVPYFQLRNQTAVEGTGYIGSIARDNTSLNIGTAGTAFPAAVANTAATIYQTKATFRLVDAATNMWSYDLKAADNIGPFVSVASGFKSLTTPLSGFTFGTSDAFDLGSLYYCYKVA